MPKQTHSHIEHERIFNLTILPVYAHVCVTPAALSGCSFCLFPGCVSVYLCVIPKRVCFCHSMVVVPH